MESSGKATASDSQWTDSAKESPAKSNSKDSTSSDNPPKYLKMVLGAARELNINNPKGATRQAILKFILTKYFYPFGGGTNSVNTEVRMALEYAVGKNMLKQAKGSSAFGSYPVDAKSGLKKKAVAGFPEKKKKNIIVEEALPSTQESNDDTAQRPTDCVLISRDGKEFPVHRSILASASSVFAEMFECDMEKEPRNTWQIDDMDGNTLEILLEFLYTERADAERIRDIVEDVYKAADKYEVGELCAACENIMVDRLSVKTALPYLNFAVDRGLDELKLRAIKFLNDNAEDI